MNEGLCSEVFLLEKPRRTVCVFVGRVTGRRGLGRRQSQACVIGIHGGLKLLDRSKPSFIIWSEW